MSLGVTSLSSADELIKAAKKFLKDTWNEDTVSMKITGNDVVNGSGKMHTDCVFSLSASSETPSKWHKVFTFKNGEITDEEYHLIYKK